MSGVGSISQGHGGLHSYNLKFGNLVNNFGKGIRSTCAVEASSGMKSWFYGWIDGRAVQRQKETRQHNGDVQALSTQTLARPLEVRKVSDSPASQVHLLLSVGGSS